MGIDKLGFREALADRYIIGRLVGAGATASVYLATDLRHERELAIKVLKPEVATAVGHERFMQEMRVTAQLTHPNILPLLDSGEAAGCLWFAMPYVEGESLRSRLDREGQLPVQEALAITREVADALDYAHARDIVHRDIKPENLLLAGGHTMVLDFGLARILGGVEHSRLTSSGVAVGTTLYMSPEQATAEHHVGPRSDLYSLACVLYEMLSGEVPWKGPTAQVTVARRLTQPLAPIRPTRPAVSHAVDRALGQALTPIPADRFPSGSAFVRALTEPAVTVEPREETILDAQQEPAKSRIVRWYDGLWQRRGVRLYLVYLVIVFFLGWSFDALQLLMLPSIVSVMSWILIALAFGLLGIPVALFGTEVVRRLGKPWRDRHRDGQEVARLEAKVDELRKERDFYRDLVEGRRDHLH